MVNRPGGSYRDFYGYRKITFTQRPGEVLDSCGKMVDRPADLVSRGFSRDTNDP